MTLDSQTLDEIEKEAKATMDAMNKMHAEGEAFWGKTQKPRALNEIWLISEIKKLQEREAAFRSALREFATCGIMEHVKVNPDDKLICGMDVGGFAREVLERYPEEKE